MKISLSPIIAQLMRWGKAYAPTWIIGSIITAPSANTTLISKTVSSGKSGYIQGFTITSPEANDFIISWRSSSTNYSIRVSFGGPGTLKDVGATALNEGYPADAGSTITINNVNAGSSGTNYQASLLYGEL